MKIVEDFKHFIGKRAINKKVARTKRVVKVCNLNNAKTIGIIFNANHIISYEIIKDFTKHLSEKGIDYNALGYVNDKELIDHYLYRKGFDFITKAQLNWYYKPSGSVVDDFVKKPFDILISLSLEKSFPIDYIVAASKAKFKVGKLIENVSYTDLMIDMEKENQVMHNLHEEINIDLKGRGNNQRFESEIQPKVETEIQLNFLINQILHYLDMINPEKKVVV